MFSKDFPTLRMMVTEKEKRWVIISPDILGATNLFTQLADHHVSMTVQTKRLAGSCEPEHLESSPLNLPQVRLPSSEVSTISSNSAT